MKYKKYTHLFVILLLLLSHYESISQVTDKVKLLQFEEAITRGEEFLQLKDYAKAKAEYQKALAIDPSAKYPKDKLAQIRKVYIDPKDESDFQSAVQKGDRLMAEGSFSEAKDQYSIALLIKPDDRIVREKSVTADKKANEKTVMLKEFEVLVSDADKLFESKEYLLAIEKYRQAQALNPADIYTGACINDAEKILDKEKALDDNYNSTITEADDAYMNRDFALAATKYAQASKLKPAENYPKSMLERVEESIKNKSFNDAEQEKILAEKHKQDSIDAAISAKKEAERLAEEARLKAASDAEEARILAAKKAEDDRLAEERLLEEKRLAEEKAAEDKKLAALETEKRRLDSIADAKTALELSQKQLEEARIAEEYRLAEEARNLADKKAEEDRIAQEKLIEDARLASEREAEEMRLANIRIEQQKQDSINSAKTALELEQKQAAEARLAEENRLAEEEKFLADKKAEEDRLAKEKQDEEARIAAEKEAEQKRLDYELASQIDKEYFDAIETANQLFKEEDFTSAIVMFEKASALKPLEELPKDRLLLIHNIQLERLKNNLEVYNKNIAAGDLAYQSNIFDKAIEEYEKATIARPEETYPGLMIGKIRKLMEENAMVNLVTNSVTLTDASEEKFKFTPVEMKLRKNNYILIKAKKTSEKAPKIFINYGKDDLKSGGIVVKSIESEETVDYLVRISSQDKWYRIDNNWISLYPEGGSIEITSMQLSQGDIQKVQ